MFFWLVAGNETNGTKIPRFVNMSSFQFEIVPNSTVNATFTSACSKLTISSSAFNLDSPYQATLQCSVLDPQTVESGLVPVSSAVSLTLPAQEGSVNYPFQLDAVLGISQSLGTTARRRLLQQQSDSSSNDVKVHAELAVVSWHGVHACGEDWVFVFWCVRCSVTLMCAGIHMASQAANLGLGAGLNI